MPPSDLIHQHNLKTDQHRQAAECISDGVVVVLRIIAAGNQ